MRRVILAAAAAILPLSSAAAQELPRFDVPAQCRTVASFGGSFSEMTYGGCMDLEQTSYDEVKRIWGELPTDLRRQCLEVARFGGEGSYMTLKGCIELERSAAQQNRSREFRYARMPGSNMRRMPAPSAEGAPVPVQGVVTALDRAPPSASS